MPDNLFKNNVTALDSDIYEVVELQKNPYDKHAGLYDKIVGNKLYNRIIWGNSLKNYTLFYEKAVSEQEGRIMTDIACGTLFFTAKIYSSHSFRHLFLCDLSEQLLRIGKKQLERLNTNLNNITFLRSDAFDMPFKDAVLPSVFSFGFFHVVDNPAKLTQEFARILQPNGKLYINSLCSDRKISALFLRFLNKKGLIAKPMNSEKICRIIQENGFKLENSQRIGGMIYITAVKK